MAAKRRILITGATGGVGLVLCDRLADDYELVMHGRTPRSPAQQEALREADLGDYDEVLTLMEGVDTVVHLAGASAPDSEWEDVLATNIIGFRNVLEAAREAGVRRFVFASSNHAMGMRDRRGEWPIYHDQPHRPDSLYGLSKCFGEDFGRLYHDEYGIDFIALRIGWMAANPMEPDRELLRAMWLSEDDTAQVVRCAIEAEVRYGVYYAISDNPNRRWDLLNTTLELGYRPKDSWTDFAEEPETVVEGGEPAAQDWPAGS